MKKIWHRFSINLLSLIVVMLVVMVQAKADPITFTANTTGVFNSGTCVTCTVDNNIVPTITSSGGGGLSAIGFVGNTGLSNTPQFTVSLDMGQSATITLGSLVGASSVPLGTGPSFTGSTFALNVNFTMPTGTTPSPGALSATLTGQLTQTSSGVQFQFSGTPLTFMQGGQTFTLTLQPSTVVVNALTPVPLTATLSLVGGGGGTAPVPEPTTLLLLGSGLATISGILKKRKKPVS